VIVERTPHTGVVGIRGEDVLGLELALHGLRYPVDKWQLIDHAQRDPISPGHPNRRAIGLLWALPTGRYLGLAQVLSGAARTCRGHPRRDNPAVVPDRNRPV
jgi:hypothetical protein